MKKTSYLKRLFNIHFLLEALQSNIVYFISSLTLIVFAVATIQNINDSSEHSIVFGVMWGAYVVVCKILSLNSDDYFFTNLAAALVKISIAVGVLQIYLKQIGFTLDHQKARFLKNHIIVHGSGEDVIALSLTFCTTTKVVLIIDHIDDSTISKLRQKGIIVFIKSGNNDKFLRHCHINRALILLAFHTEYAENITLCKRAIRLVDQDSPLRCLCSIPNLSLKNGLSTADFFNPEDILKVKFINLTEITALKMMDKFPPDIDISDNENVLIRIVLIGLGSISQSFLFYLGQLGHFRGGHKPIIKIIDKNAAQQYQNLIKRTPALEHLLKIEIIESNIGDLSMLQISDIFGLSFSPSIVYVCTKNEICNVTSAKKIETVRTANELHYKIVVLDPPGGNLIQEFNQHSKKIDVISPFSIDYNSEEIDLQRDSLRLFEFAKDQLAQKIYEDYLDKNPINKVGKWQWQFLDEKVRDTNRYPAAHIEIKLRAIGRKIGPFNPDTPKFKFSKQEIEILAKMEHSRWCAEKKIAGWQFGAIRNDKQLLHNCLISYDTLDETEKNKDRQSVENIPHLLRLANLMVI